MFTVRCLDLKAEVDKPVVMNQNFDRAPGGTFGGQGDAITTLFNQREPLRQPRTSPPLPDNSYLPNEAGVRGGKEPVYFNGVHLYGAGFTFKFMQRG